MGMGLRGGALPFSPRKWGVGKSRDTDPARGEGLFLIEAMNDKGRVA